MNDKPVVNPAEALFFASGRAFLAGSVAGISLAALLALAQLPMGELSYQAPIAAGVLVVFLFELCAMMLESKSAYLRLVASTLTLLLLGFVWLLASKVSPFNLSFWLLLGSSGGAVAVDVGVRLRGERRSAHFLWIAAGAGLGSLLSLLLIPRPMLAWTHSYGLCIVSAIPAGTLLCLALRVRVSPFKSPGPRSSSGDGL